MQIILKVPQRENIIFDSYEKLDIIWEVLELYPGCSLEVVYDEAQLPAEEPVPEQVKESVVLDFDSTDDSAIVEYILPKSVALISDFQKSLQKDVEYILSSVYPGSFKVSKAKYIDLDSKDSDMQVSFDVKAKNDEEKSKLKYLDENIKYIIDDNVKYYSK